MIIPYGGDTSKDGWPSRDCWGEEKGLARSFIYVIPASSSDVIVIVMRWCRCLFVKRLNGTSIVEKVALIVGYYVNIVQGS